MKKLSVTDLKYAAIAFACFVIAMSILRTLGRLDHAPGVAGAIMLSMLVSSADRGREIQVPDA